MGFFLEARHIQAIHRQNNVIPSIEKYIDIRRDSSAFKPLFDFIEYTLQVDFPEEVMEHPVVQSLKESANDFCTWANVRKRSTHFIRISLTRTDWQDIYSYNKEQACGDSYNLVVLFMKQYDSQLQNAVNTVGDMCFTVLDNFETYKRRLPSWGSQVDKDLGRYIEGLENFMIGCLQWGYMSGRYFGTEGPNIKETRVVKLLPRRTKK